MTRSSKIRPQAFRKLKFILNLKLLKIPYLLIKLIDKLKIFEKYDIKEF